MEDKESQYLSISSTYVDGLLIIKIVDTKNI